MRHCRSCRECQRLKDVGFLDQLFYLFVLTDTGTVRCGVWCYCGGFGLLTFIVMHSGGDSCEGLAVAGLGSMKCLLCMDGSCGWGGGVGGNVIHSVSLWLSILGMVLLILFRP